MATKALFLYGDTFPSGEQAGRSQRGTLLDSTAFEPNVNSTPQQQDAFDLTGFGTPTMHSTFREPSSPNYASPANTSTALPLSPPAHPPLSQNVEFSYTPRHNAIYLIVGRILLPFWHRKIVSTSIVRNVATRPTKIVSEK